MLTKVKQFFYDSRSSWILSLLYLEVYVSYAFWSSIFFGKILRWKVRFCRRYLTKYIVALINFSELLFFFSISIFCSSSHIRFKFIEFCLMWTWEKRLHTGVAWIIAISNASWFHYLLMLGVPHLKEVFYRMGLSDKDIVALSGGHTLVISLTTIQNIKENRKFFNMNFADAFI